MIGYYLNTDYSSFHAVHLLDEGTTTAGYIQHIEPGHYISLKFGDYSGKEPG